MNEGGNKMENILEKIIIACAFVIVTLCAISLNFWAIMECYGKILILCSIMKVLFCCLVLIGSISLICLVIMMLLWYAD